MRKDCVSKKGPVGFLLERSLQLFGDNLVSVVLFGSCARKHCGKNSDLDFIIVLEKDGDYGLSELRMDFLVRFEKRLDLQIFSKEDVVGNFESCSPLFATLLLGSHILFDKEMFFKTQFDNFVKSMTSMDVKYCEGDKIWEIQKIAKGLEALQ